MAAVSASPGLPFRMGVAERFVLGLACGVLIAIGARIEAPMAPVPMSMQSFAVLLTGAVLGWRGGSGVVLAYLALGALGLPVFAEGASGWRHFTGPTAGYLIAFPIAAGLIGIAAERGWMDRPLPGFCAGIAGHAVLLGLGTAWLAIQIGAGSAMAGGFTPFLTGALAKSALLALTVWGLARWRPLRLWRRG